MNSRQQHQRQNINLWFYVVMLLAVIAILLMIAELTCGGWWNCFPGSNLTFTTDPPLAPPPAVTQPVLAPTLAPPQQQQPQAAPVIPPQPQVIPVVPAQPQVVPVMPTSAPVVATIAIPTIVPTAIPVPVFSPDAQTCNTTLWNNELPAQGCFDRWNYERAQGEFTQLDIYKVQARSNCLSLPDSQEDDCILAVNLAISIIENHMENK